MSQKWNGDEILRLLLELPSRYFHESAADAARINSLCIRSCVAQKSSLAFLYLVSSNPRFDNWPLGLLVACVLHGFHVAVDSKVNKIKYNS